MDLILPVTNLKLNCLARVSIQGKFGNQNIGMPSTVDKNILNWIKQYKLNGWSTG